MKTLRSLFVVALGLFFAFNAFAMDCPKCKGSIPSDTKPVVWMTKANMKCSVCGADIKAGTNVQRITCSACKAEIDLCSLCEKHMMAPAQPAA